MTRTGASGMTGRSVLTTPSLTGNIHRDNHNRSLIIMWMVDLPRRRMLGAQAVGSAQVDSDIKFPVLTKSLVRSQWSGDDVRPSGGGDL